jgi:hypothetical protein
LPNEVAQLTLAQFYYYKNIAWYNHCAISQIDIDTYDKLLEGNYYSIKKRKLNKLNNDMQQRALSMIIKDGKKPSIKLIREYIKKIEDDFV